MHWVHLIRAPTATRQQGSTWTVSLLVRIMSDLSDRELNMPISVYVSLASLDAEEVRLVWQRDNWKPKYWLEPLKIEFRERRQNLVEHFLRISASTSDNKSKLLNFADTLNFVDSTSGLPPVISAFSGALNLASETELASGDMAFRWLRGIESAEDEASQLKIWERTGESMERHMWDGGIAFAAYLKKGMTVSRDSALSDSTFPPLRVVELGCGVGTVGIHFAQLVPDSDVTLTDLEGAQEMVERNIKSAHPARGSSMRFEKLDWANYRPGNAQDPVTYPVDLILIADCFYNNSMCKDLIRTINALVGHDDSWQAPVVVAYKFRDASEEVFFADMEPEYEITHEVRLELPDLDGVQEHVRIIVYRSRKRRTPPGLKSAWCPEKVEHHPIRVFWD